MDRAGGRVRQVSRRQHAVDDWVVRPPGPERFRRGGERQPHDVVSIHYYPAGTLRLAGSPGRADARIDDSDGRGGGREAAVRRRVQLGRRSRDSAPYTEQTNWVGRLQQVMDNGASRRRTSTPSPWRSARRVTTRERPSTRPMRRGRSTRFGNTPGRSTRSPTRPVSRIATISASLLPAAIPHSSNPRPLTSVPRYR